MHLQLARREPRLKRRLYSESFVFGSTMHEPIVRIAAPREIWKSSREPNVKRIMEKQIRQQWTDYAALRRALVSLDQDSILALKRRCKPAFDV